MGLVRPAAIRGRRPSRPRDSVRPPAPALP